MIKKMLQLTIIFVCYQTHASECTNAKKASVPYMDVRLSVQFPSEKQMQERLKNFNLQDFAQKTSIHEQFGGKLMDVLDMENRLNFLTHWYYNQLDYFEKKQYEYGSDAIKAKFSQCFKNELFNIVCNK